MRTIRARYAGRCTTCRQRISVGERMVYGGKGKTWHVGCAPGDDPGDNGGGNSPTDTVKSSGKKRPTLPPELGTKVFTVDWVELKRTLLAAYEGDFSAYPQHVSEVTSNLLNPRESWHGYDGKTARRWLERGYQTDAIKGLGDFNPPLREKRRVIFGEEGDELNYDLVAVGEEFFMTEWSKHEEIPGASVQIALGFSAGVSDTVLTRYAAWVCKAIYSLDMAGIDTEIMLHYMADNMVNGESGPHDTRIRVKSEGENLDFLSFSAMLSPAQFRCYTFCAMYLHCESRGRKITSGHGHSLNYFNQWAVRYDREQRKLFIDCDYRGYNFNEELMETQLREALREMSQ